MMKNIKIKNFIYIIILVSAVSWTLLALKNELQLSNLKDFYGFIPQVVTIDMLLIGIFIKWGWKTKLLRGILVPFPNLNGTWIGTIHSDWIDPNTGERVKPIPTMLTIYQTFVNINCIMHTGEMKSYSISEGFNIDEEKQIKQISYIYTSKPRNILSDRSIQHDGAIVFDIIEKKQRKLKGEYWTTRKTKGEILLSFYCKEVLEELPSDMGLHPVTENENLYK